MGTHPIFESDFDCLTDKNVESTSIGFTHQSYQTTFRFPVH